MIGESASLGVTQLGAVRLRQALSSTMISVGYSLSKSVRILADSAPGLLHIQSEG